MSYGFVKATGSKRKKGERWDLKTIKYENQNRKPNPVSQLWFLILFFFFLGKTENQFWFLIPNRTPTPVSNSHQTERQIRLSFWIFCGNDEYA